MATQQNAQCVSIPAGSDLSAKQYYFMDIVAGKLAVAGAGTRVAGVLTNDPPAANKDGVLQYGGIAKVIAGGSIASGAGVASDANGKAVTATGSAFVCGISTYATTAADGDLIEVLLTGASAVGLAATEETVTSGALNPGVGISYLSITGPQSYTLDDGSYVGQRKSIECTVAASSPLGTLTLNDAYGSEPTTHVFNTVGQRIVVEWRTGGWKVIDKKRAGSLTVVVGTDVLTGYDMVETYNLSITGTVSSTTTKAIPDGTVEGEVIWLRCTTAASTPNGSIGITAKLLAGTAATAAAVNATTDYEYLRWDGAAWQEIITNSVTLS